jgi:hypothetical protein
MAGFSIYLFLIIRSVCFMMLTNVISPSVHDSAYHNDRFGYTSQPGLDQNSTLCASFMETPKYWALSVP